MKNHKTKVVNNAPNHNQVYPFIDELVDTLHSEGIKSIIQEKVQSDMDKSIFLTFVLMYYVINLKLQSVDSDDYNKCIKQQIKSIMSQIIRDPEQRKACLLTFESYFRQFFPLTNPPPFESSIIENDVKRQLDNEFQ